MRRLVRSAFLTTSTAAIRVLLGLVANKVLAVVAGPAGLGFASLVRQTYATALAGASVGAPNALVQGLASGSPEERPRLVRLAGTVFAAGGLLIGLVLLLGARWWAPAIFGPDEPRALLAVRVLGVAVAVGAAATFVESIANGLHDLRRLAMLQTVGAVLATALAAPVALSLRAGHSVPIVLWTCSAAGGSLLVGIWAGWRRHWFKGVGQARVGRWSDPQISRFLAFCPTMLAVALCGVVPVLVARALVARQGFAALGIFDAGWTLGTAYLGVILSAFGTFYFPQLAARRKPGAQSLLARQMLRLAAGAGLPAIVLVLLLHPTILPLVYSGEFLAAHTLLRWMLVGDFFRIAGWVVGMPLQSNADLRATLVSELAAAGAMCVLLAGLVPRFGYEGVGMAYLFVNIGYVLAMHAYVRHRHDLKLGGNLRAWWVLGAAIVVAVAAVSWNRTPSMLVASACIVVAGAWAYWMFAGNRGRERDEPGPDPLTPS